MVGPNRRLLNVTVWLTASELAQLDDLATTCGASRSSLLRSLIRSADRKQIGTVIDRDGRCAQRRAVGVSDVAK